MKFKMSTCAYFVLLVTLTNVIKQSSSYPSKLPKGNEQINSPIANVTFFTDEYFKGIAEIQTINLTLKSTKRNLGNNTFSSMQVNEPKELEKICFVLFPNKECQGGDYWVVKNETNITQFGKFNDKVRCFRICNDNEEERGRSSKSFYSIETDSTLSNAPISSTRLSPREDFSKTVELRFHQDEEFKGTGNRYNISSDHCINLHDNQFSSVEVISPNPTCVLLFIVKECRSKEALIVKGNTTEFGLLNDKIKSFCLCSAKL